MYKKFGELMELALKVNEETHHSVFLNFSGHVNYIEIKIQYGGYNSEARCVDTYVNFYIKNPDKKLNYEDWLKDQMNGDRSFKIYTDKVTYINKDENDKKYADAINYLNMLLAESENGKLLCTENG